MIARLTTVCLLLAAIPASLIGQNEDQERLLDEMDDDSSFEEFVADTESLLSGEVEYEEAPVQDPYNYEALKDEEAILYDTSLVLDPEFLPANAITLRIGASPLPPFLFGFNHAFAMVQYELMYRPNFTFTIRAGATGQLGFPTTGNRARQGVEGSDSNFNIGFGIGNTWRLRLDSMINGFFMGGGLELFWFPTLSMRYSGAVYNADATDDAATDVDERLVAPTAFKDLHYRSEIGAFAVIPQVEVGYTLASGSFVAEFAAAAGFITTMGLANAVVVSDVLWPGENPTDAQQAAADNADYFTEYFCLDGSACYNNATVYNEGFSIHFHLYVNLAAQVGIRF